MTRFMSDFARRSVSDKTKHELQWRYKTSFDYCGFLGKICKYSN